MEGTTKTIEIENIPNNSDAEKEEKQKARAEALRAGVKELKAEGFKQGAIADNAGLCYTTLSCFMRDKKDYVTNTIMDKLEQYLKRKKVNIIY